MDAKLRIFTDVCQRSAVDNSIWHRAFPSMLRGDAQEYYYNHLQGKELTFTQLVDATRASFETEERAGRFLRRWFTVTLERFQEEPQQKGKTLIQQLDSFGKELQSL